MTHLSPATAGTLRERFIEDMTVCGFTDKTRKDYIRTVAGFAAFLERSPSSATAEDVRRFQIHQSERGMNAPAMNSAVGVVQIRVTLKTRISLLSEFYRFPVLPGNGTL